MENRIIVIILMLQNMIKIILTLFISWLIIRCIRFLNKIKIISNTNRSKSIKTTKINADIQDGEFEDVE